MQEKIKQETLEEAAEKLYREYPNNPLNKPEWHYNKDVNCFKKRKAFINGAKWQAERMYSDIEKLISLLQQTTEYEVLQSFRDKVEQFKKK
jgi:hypothetical protein